MHLYGTKSLGTLKAICGKQYLYKGKECK
ncbi:hypothetical protein Goari_006366 [Gossypium aridum]|uniref:Uncharacterized protein n=1 Tax=Gossypium aridum TaxID=34290 RepID=A0A7J8XMP0_GOSAI|nr:hypothetical protein [Gossypium aridum]